LSVSANRPLTIEELRDSISSELEGNPPLWITRKQVKHNVEVYINNAKILLEQSNFQSKLKVNGDTMTQASRRSSERQRLELCDCELSLALANRKFPYHGAVIS